MRVVCLALVALCLGCGRLAFDGRGSDAGTGDTTDALPFDSLAPDTIPPDLIGGRALLIPMDDEPAIQGGAIATSDPSLAPRCTFGSCPVSTPGQRGGAYHFDGNDGFSIPRPELLDTTSTFTVGMWMRPSMPGRAMDAVAKPYSLTSLTDVFAVYVSIDGTASLESTPDGIMYAYSANNATVTDGWHHVAATWNGAIIKLYVDGVENVENPNTTAPSDMPIEVGRDLDNGSEMVTFIGDLDELVFYDRELTAGEVATLATL